MITLDGDGTVIGVSAPEDVNSLPQVEFYSGVLIPGMVNAHTHLELSYLKGAIPAGEGFAGFAAGIRRNRGRFPEEDILGAADYNDARMWVEGVQAAGDICNGSDTFRIKEKSHIRYHSFIELFGLGTGAEQVGRAEGLRDDALGRGLPATVTPHSLYSLNEEGFRQAAGGAGNSPLSIHFMESPDETELFQGRGAMKEWYDAEGLVTDFTSSYASPAERLAALVPAVRKVMLVHNTTIGQREIDMLSGHFGDNVTFVLCPRSNKFITGLMPPAGLLRENKVRIAVGTDSLASNRSLSMIEELKVFSGIPLFDLLSWATAGGAEALGMDGILGSFEPGKRPGVVQLTGVGWDDLTLLPDAATKRII